jgi:hypothetical protein
MSFSDTEHETCEITLLSVISKDMLVQLTPNKQSGVYGSDPLVNSSDGCCFPFPGYATFK